MRVIGTDGRLSEPLQNVPRVFDSGQGGLLDVSLDPAFAENRILYFTFAEPGRAVPAPRWPAHGFPKPALMT